MEGSRSSEEGGSETLLDSSFQFLLSHFQQRDMSSSRGRSLGFGGKFTRQSLVGQQLPENLSPGSGRNFGNAENFRA